MVYCLFQLTQTPVVHCTQLNGATNSNIFSIVLARPYSGSESYPVVINIQKVFHLLVQYDINVCNSCRCNVVDVPVSPCQCLHYYLASPQTLCILGILLSLLVPSPWYEYLFPDRPPHCPHRCCLHSERETFAGSAHNVRSRLMRRSAPLPAPLPQSHPQ